MLKPFPKTGVLALDIGTSSVRAVVYDIHGRMRAATLLIRVFFGARSAHQARMAVISFETQRGSV